MTRIAIMFVGATLLAWPAPQTPPVQQQPPTFTANTDVVYVDVSVRKSGRQLTGLTAADFELRDNGVKQDIDTVEAAAVPIDLSIIVDVSGNPDRPWENLPTPARVAADLDTDVKRLVALLRAGDRVRLFAQDTYVQPVWPLQVASSVPRVERVAFDGQSSLYDTLTAVLLQPVEPRRRHVIVAATKGLDTVSAVSATDIGAIAAHADAQLHMVMLEMEADKEATVRPFQCANMGLCRPTYRFWTPARRRLFIPQPITGPAAPLHTLTPDGVRVRNAAESTGGDLYQAEALSEPTLYGVFAKAFENFRQSYILRYSPKGVARAGWHDITVTVPRDKSVTIRSRNGYTIDGPTAPPARRPGATGDRLMSLPDMMAAYAESRYDLVDMALRQVVNPAPLIKEFDFTAGMNPFPGTYRSEAAFALDLAAIALFSQPTETRDAGRSLLQRYSRLIRPPFEPDDYEHVWLTAVIALLQGRISPPLSEPFIERALARFPNEPRFMLARAIVMDQQWRGFGSMTFGALRTATEIPIKEGTALMEAYEAVAAASPELAAEARIRGAWFLYRVGRADEALKALDSARPLPQDRGMEYLRHLFKSHILTSQQKYDDAAAAARVAHVLIPEAQSARVALMNALTLKGDAAAAEAVAENIEAAPKTDDPWWTYWLGDFRWYGAAREILRGMAK